MSYYDSWTDGYSLLSNEMPESLKDWPAIDVENVEREGNKLFKPYIFSRARKEDTELWCSCCMEHEHIHDNIAHDNAEMQILWAGHKDGVYCPHCGKSAQLFDTRYIRTGKALRESRPIVVLSERDGDIYARAYWMKKDYSTLPTYEWGVRPMFYLVGAYRFTEGRAEYWAQHNQWNEFDCEAEEGKINPSRRKVREPFTEGCGSWLSYSAYAVVGIEAIAQSRFRYCQYMEHERPIGKHHRCLMRYLAAASIYPRQVEMLHKMGFNSILEIIEEGRGQKHCVAGYAERHLADKLTICFLRRAETPNTALYTIEMQGNELIQIHGYKNDWEAEVKPMDAMGWFIGPWLKWLEAGSPRDKQGRPKIKFTKEERKTA